MTENSLVLMTRASQMLGEATTIQKAKELKDLALTAADFARRKGLGEEALQYAKNYAFDAERRMGEMLRETDEKRAKGTRGMGRPTLGGYYEMPPKADEPTLAKLGITKRESFEARALGALPEETFEAVKTGKTTLTQVKREQTDPPFCRCDHTK